MLLVFSFNRAKINPSKVVLKKVKKLKSKVKLSMKFTECVNPNNMLVIIVDKPKLTLRNLKVGIR
jgi:hypothetical protein